jgi:hypothetical protein
MITITVLIIIWVIVSVCKILHNADNFDKMVYGIGLCVGASIFVCALVYLIIIYLP